MAPRRRRPGLVYPTYEDWHYVGEAGEPDWDAPAGTDAWENDGASFNLAFRNRETGIVDIQGRIIATADPPAGSIVFVLPLDYRPSGGTWINTTGRTTSDDVVPVSIYVDPIGSVSVVGAGDDPFPAAGATDALSIVNLMGQVFLDPATAP